MRSSNAWPVGRARGVQRRCIHKLEELSALRAVQPANETDRRNACLERLDTMFPLLEPCLLKQIASKTDGNVWMACSELCEASEKAGGSTSHATRSCQRRRLSAADGFQSAEYLSAARTHLLNMFPWLWKSQVSSATYVAACCVAVTRSEKLAGTGRTRAVRSVWGVAPCIAYLAMLYVQSDSPVRVWLHVSACVTVLEVCRWFRAFELFCVKSRRSAADRRDPERAQRPVLAQLRRTQADLGE
jgi:hypothetical protein